MQSMHSHLVAEISNVSLNISSISNNIKSAIEEENNIISSKNIVEKGILNISTKEIPIEICVTLKEYLPTFVANITISNKTYPMTTIDGNFYLLYNSNITK